MQQSRNRVERNSLHILAHTLLGAAVAATGGNNALTAGVAAGGAEVVAPKLAQYLYGKKPSNLTADEKSTISAITVLVASGAGATTGNASNIVQGGRSSQNAVENNALETVWDVANLAIGAASFGYNIHEGNYGSAAIDGVGLVYDGIATAVPFLPAGASASLEASRAGNNIKDSVVIGADVAQASKAANVAAKNSKNITKNPAVTGTKIHRETGLLLGEANGTASKLSDSASSYFKGANASTGKQPDMSWKDKGVWADLTTPKQWAAHEKKYNSTFGEGVSILYKPGQGVVETTKLPTGAGVLIAVPNNI